MDQVIFRRLSVHEEKNTDFQRKILYDESGFGQHNKQIHCFFLEPGCAVGYLQR